MKTFEPFERLVKPAKTVREVELEGLLRDCLPFVLVDKHPSSKTAALIERVLKETE